MSYLVAPGLIASNCLMALQRVLPSGSRENRATLETGPIAWLSHRLSTETRYGKFTFRIA